MSYALDAVDLRRSYGRLLAVAGLDLRVKTGEIYGLLGPNGAGKTTLIRMLAGLLKPDTGSISLFGVRMPDKTVLTRVGYMTQAPALYEDLTVYENLRFFASMCGVYDRTRIEETLELVSLADRRASKVYTLSGGMKRRASLACALVHKPELLLLDEPTVGIDPQLRAAFWDHFRETVKRGATIVVSSHVMDEAARCDRLGFMRTGKLIAEGSRTELLRQAKEEDLEAAFLTFAKREEAR